MVVGAKNTPTASGPRSARRLTTWGEVVIRV
jgi:hypothetical protein